MVHIETLVIAIPLGIVLLQGIYAAYDYWKGNYFSFFPAILAFFFVPFGSTIVLLPLDKQMDVQPYLNQMQKDCADTLNISDKLLTCNCKDYSSVESCSCWLEGTSCIMRDGKPAIVAENETARWS